MSCQRPLERSNPLRRRCQPCQRAVKQCARGRGAALGEIPSWLKLEAGSSGAQAESFRPGPSASLQVNASAGSPQQQPPPEIECDGTGVESALPLLHGRQPVVLLDLGKAAIDGHCAAKTVCSMSWRDVPLRPES